MKEFDAVRVVRLIEPTRHYDGTEAVKRQPRVDDTGAIVHVHEGGEAFAVECVNGDGLTVWLADFRADELEVLS